MGAHGLGYADFVDVRYRFRCKPWCPREASDESLDVRTDFNWVVHDDLCGSDHFPTFLNYDGRPTPEYPPRWNFKKADWDEFKNKCKSELTPAFFETENSNIHMKLFTSTLHDLSVSAIP